MCYITKGEKEFQGVDRAKMRYRIITNPVSGAMNAEQKRSALAEAAEILGAKIHGLDTVSADEFRRCAAELADQCDVLVAAGGDGTFSDILNSIDTRRTPVGFLPLGSGNALRHGLHYKGSLAHIATCIRDGRVHQYDLIGCDGKKRAFTASVGIEGTIVRLWQRYRSQGRKGFKTYCKAVFDSYFKEYKRTNGIIQVDGDTFEVENLLTLMVVKQPYYGYGMNVVPKARFDDGKLHTLHLTCGLVTTLIAGLTAFTVGNLFGTYRSGEKLTVALDHPLVLQIDGNEGWEADSYSFRILPQALRIKC
jgi:diacylglycerol kinase family enzyme